MIQSLSALSRTYDTLSFSDAYLSVPSDFKEGPCSRHTQDRWCSGKLTSGMSDEKKYYDESNWWKRNYCDEISSEVNCRNLHTTNIRIRNCVNDITNLPSESVDNVKDRLAIPVPTDSLDQVMAKDETSLQLRYTIYCLVVEICNYFPSKFNVVENYQYRCTFWLIW